ncbi:MarR family winged helix-turn-helix transcriptional regulator [Epibacterium ulvae]|uniref:MarR family winged helix-turn-helix transcriptional regulator n=1 Tax=Epibacterium ulvae TaxID=1156985 RepID=UPI002492E5C6|nr:MarR family winged helix-turn-helix transcriptional regulator [Epibacterium ulvae]
MTNAHVQEIYDLHSRLGFRLTRLSNLMKARLDKILAPHGLSRLSWCALTGIGLQDITTPSQLADHLGITRQAVSRLLLQMRKNGLVEQSFDTSDGRARRLALSTYGNEKLALCHPLVDENQQYFAAKISQSELHQFNQTIDALLDGETARLDEV